MAITLAVTICWHSASDGGSESDRTRPLRSTARQATQAAAELAGCPSARRPHHMAIDPKSWRRRRHSAWRWRTRPPIHAPARRSSPWR